MKLMTGSYPAWKIVKQFTKSTCKSYFDFNNQKSHLKEISNGFFVGGKKSRTSQDADVQIILETNQENKSVITNIYEIGFVTNEVFDCIKIKQ